MELMFLIAAVVGGTIMVCQFVLTVFGIGGDVDVDAAGDLDVGDMTADILSPGAGNTGGGATAVDGQTAHGADHSHPDSGKLFSILSFRTLVAGTAFFGVAGQTALSAGVAEGTSLVIAVLFGFGALYGMYWLLTAISSLTSSGNEQIANSLGKTGSVCVAVPSAGTGVGKIQFSMQNRLVDYPAVTDEGRSIATGEVVEIVGIVGGDTLKVRRLAVST